MENHVKWRENGVNVTGGNNIIDKELNIKGLVYMYICRCSYQIYNKDVV
jgi:hypothetical protein